MLTLKALTEEQRKQYERDGFLVVQDLFSPEEIVAVKECLAHYIREGLRMLREGKKPEQDTVTHEGVHIQLEPLVAQGKYVPDDPLYAARKVWNLFGNDKVLTQFATNPKLLDIVEDLLGTSAIWFYADKAMLKPPKIGVEKPWHQDLPYFPFEPKDEPHIHVAAWIALDEATLENGCMQYIPDSHKLGNITTAHVDTYGLGHLAADMSKVETNETVVVEAKPGDVSFHDGLTLHYSAPNASDKPRWALVLDFINAERARYVGKGEPKFPRLR
ncbi:MAG: phytanoyl-CoA dioxygenase family protein [Armatimonadota bacterium]